MNYLYIYVANHWTYKLSSWLRLETTHEFPWLLPYNQQTANSTLGSSKLAASVLIEVEATDNHNLKDFETVETNGESTVQANVMIQTLSVVQERNLQVKVSAYNLVVPLKSCKLQENLNHGSLLLRVRRKCAGFWAI